MSDIAYNEQLEEFRAQLRRKERERDVEMARYDREIEALTKIVETLSDLTGKSHLKAKELDSLILDIFKRNPRMKIARRTLLKKLIESGADLSGFNNRMAYVHASVDRLYKKGVLRREWASIPDSTKKKLFYFLAEDGS
jgi:hypothetical protein